MAAHYIETIAKGLHQYDNGSRDLQFYKDLAWEGLLKTTSWDTKQEIEKKRIENVITTERKNGNKDCN